MSTGYEVVDEGHVGGREQVPSEWKTIRAVFHNFADLPSERGKFIESPVLECHGLKWAVMLFPGGDSSSSSRDEARISLFLKSLSCSEQGISIKAANRIRVPSAGKSKGAQNEFLTHSKKDANWGRAKYALRSAVLDPSERYLVNGDLTVEVDIQVMLDKPPSWTPTNTVCSDMLKLLDTANAENSDVVFEIEETTKGSKMGQEREKGSPHPHSFYAHRTILSARCPTLAALAEDSSPGAPIPIEDVEPDMFRMLLRFLYVGEMPSTDVLKKQGKCIIRAADKYGCTGLKLAAEAELASDGIGTENAAELILFADGTSCAMLKEAAMDYFVKNAQVVMASEGFEQVKESPVVLTELMGAMAAGTKKRPASPDAADGRDYKRMRVATLRQKLDDKELDVDGSKEMLISRLEAADAAAQATSQGEAENGESGFGNEDSDEDEESDEEEESDDEEDSDEDNA